MRYPGESTFEIKIGSGPRLHGAAVATGAFRGRSPIFESLVEAASCTPCRLPGERRYRMKTCALIVEDAWISRERLSEFLSTVEGISALARRDGLKRSGS